MTTKLLKASQRIKILGKGWLLKFVKYPELGLGASGDCSSPDEPGRRIRIDSTLEGEHMLEILIHEFLHAAFWWLDEQYVRQFAKDLAVILLHPNVRSRWDK